MFIFHRMRRLLKRGNRLSMIWMTDGAANNPEVRVSPTIRLLFPILTHESDETIRLIREAESLSLMRAIGVRDEDLHFLGYPSGQIMHCFAPIVESLRTLLVELAPDEVYTVAYDQSEFEQWGGDLNDNITRVLAANLGALLNTDRVSLYPWKGIAPIDFQVSMDITRFEQDVDGSVVLDVFWSIASPAKDKVMLMQRASYRETPAAAAAGGREAYDAMIAAMNRDLLALSRDIAAAIPRLGKP